MGLSILVRWGVEFDEDGSCLDFPQEVRQAQYKIHASEAGSIDHNWSSVSFCCNTAQALNAPDPILGLYPDWNGYNGEEIRITNQEMDRLLEWQKTAGAWLYGQRKTPKGVTKDDFQYFCLKISHSITLINFLRQHTDKPGLRLEFN